MIFGANRSLFLALCLSSTICWMCLSPGADAEPGRRDRVKDEPRRRDEDEDAERFGRWDDEEGSDDKDFLPFQSHSHESAEEEEDFSPLKFCYDKKQTGDCKNRLRRYYFDADSGYCKKFTYGGCGGNANRFKSMKECNKFCEEPVYATDEEIDQHLFDTLGIGKRPEFCNDNKISGLCRAHFPRFYFDKDTKTCKKFVYGGCGGNANRFESKKSCEKFCKEPVSVKERDIAEHLLYTLGIGKRPNFCNKKKEVGPCKMALPRFYFDRQSGKCKKFTYGGCAGNANRFETKDGCKKFCDEPIHATQKEIEDHIKATEPPKRPDFCGLKQEAGTCKKSFNRYFFDGTTCKDFVYGGCEGNANRFVSEEDCNKFCKDVKATEKEVAEHIKKSKEGGDGPKDKSK